MEPTKDGLYKFDEMNFYVLESMDDLVRVIDSNKNIIYANRSMLKKMKFDPVGKPCKCKDRNTTELIFKEGFFPLCLVEREKNNYTTIFREITIGNKIYSVKSSPIIKENKEVVGSVEVFRDITEESKTKFKILKANKKMREDITFAKNIQSKSLPAKEGYVGVDFDYIYIPSEQLSGDFFDIIEIDDNRIGFYIADVAGHGVTASILTMFIRQSMRNLNERGKLIKPSMILAKLRDIFSDLNLEDNEYFTLLYGLYNRKTKVLTYANGGSTTRPLHIRKDKVEFLNSKGLPISGIFAGIKYEDYEIKLKSGDVVLLYTDGIIEFKSLNGEQYGENRLIESVRGNEADFIDKIMESFGSFVKNATVSDDIALLSMEVK